MEAIGPSWTSTSLGAWEAAFCRIGEEDRIEKGEYADYLREASRSQIVARTRQREASKRRTCDAVATGGPSVELQNAPQVLLGQSVS